MPNQAGPDNSSDRTLSASKVQSDVQGLQSDDTSSHHIAPQAPQEFGYTSSSIAPYTPPDSSPKIVLGSSYLSLPRSPETWLVEPLLPRGGSLLLYGDPKVGKSFAALQLAVALAEGSEWLVFPCQTTPLPDSKENNRVVYIQLDTPRSLWADRLERLLASGLEVDKVFHSDRELLQTWPFNILLDEHWIMLKEELSSLSPDCVIIDTLREAHGGDENDSTAMQAVISRLEAAVKPAALVLVAHGRKVNPETGPSLINDNRGSNYVVGKMDAVCHLSRNALSVGGRAVEEQTIHLSRGDNFTWELQERDKTKRIARDLLSQPGLSLRQQARLLSEKTGKDEAACLSLLHRLKEQ